jgi:hypothetical protein
MNYIQGEKFKPLAKWIYVPEGHNSKENYDNLQNTLNWTLLKRGDIVYTHTYFVKQLFEELLDSSKSNKYFYLITHNSDINIDERIIPQNIIKWYAQNVNFCNSRLISIPIGIENSKWLMKFGKFKFFKRYNSFAAQISRDYLVYLNHNITTNIKVRLPLYNMFEGKRWVTAVHGRNGNNISGYFEALRNHKFIFCPEGNGIDTHRFWEALYFGCIPIVKWNINISFYANLPILIVDDWDEVNEQFLLNSHKHILNRFEKRNLSMLNFDYWKDKILNHE